VTQFHRYRTYHNNVARRAFAPTKSGFPSVFDQAAISEVRLPKSRQDSSADSFANFSPCVTQHRGIHSNRVEVAA
jgi:hypothetical protein